MCVWQKQSHEKKETKEKQMNEKHNSTDRCSQGFLCFHIAQRRVMVLANVFRQCVLFARKKEEIIRPASRI